MFWPRRVSFRSSEMYQGCGLYHGCWLLSELFQFHEALPVELRVAPLS